MTRVSHEGRLSVYTKLKIFELSHHKTVQELVRQTERVLARFPRAKFKQTIVFRRSVRANTT